MKVSNPTPHRRGRPHEPPVHKTCEVCKKVFKVYPYRAEQAKFCSNKCRFKGVGKYISESQTTHIPRLSSQGYWFLHIPKHPRANKQGYVKMADLSFEKYHRPLKDDEIVHHKDRCKTNDHPDNLEAMDDFSHKSLHSFERWHKIP